MRCTLCAEPVVVCLVHVAPCRTCSGPCAGHPVCTACQAAALRRTDVTVTRLSLGIT